jgi:hypothetical protein
MLNAGHIGRGNGIVGDGERVKKPLIAWDMRGLGIVSVYGEID